MYEHVRFVETVLTLVAHRAAGVAVRSLRPLAA
jgi:hypothetical protein